MESKMLFRDGASIQQYVFGPVGSDNTLQKMITHFLHNRICADGQYTLAELGYLHMNTISYVEDHVEVKIYFHPGLATDKHTMKNGQEYRTPKKIFQLFQNYLFIGAVEDAITFDTITTPKFYVEKDENGRPALRIRRNTKKVSADTNVLVLRCNLALTMAAIMNINLMNPHYKVEYETVGAANKKDRDAHIIISGNKQEYPVRVFVEHEVQSNEYYDPDVALPYIDSRIRINDEALRSKRKIQQSVSEKAEKLNKKQKKFSSKSINTRW